MKPCRRCAGRPVHIRTEFSRGVADRFDESDGNRDGQIVASEVDALRGPLERSQGSVAATVLPPLVKALLMTVDKDGDKILGKAEYTAGAEAIFLAPDAGKDAVVTREELHSLPARLLKSSVQ